MKKLLIGLSALLVLLLGGCATPSPTGGTTGGNSAIQLKKACDLNNGEECFRLGVLYHDGLGVKQDYSKAKKYFSKACDLNNGEGCLRLGWLYREKNDYSKAKKYTKKACDLKNVTGCISYEIHYKGK